MIIECSRCQTRAKLPDSKEGAKVRCPECGHVYVAQAGGARAGAARRKEDPTKYFIIGGAILVFAILAIIGSRGGNEEAPVEAAAPVREDTGPRVPTQGFDSLLVKEARNLHNLAAATGTASLLLKIDFEAVHAWELQLAAAPAEVAVEGAPEGEEDVSAADPTADPTADPAVAYAGLTAAGQQIYRNDVISGLTKGRWKDMVADWLPYDGTIVAETTERATVRVRCHHRNSSLNLPDRWVEWRFHMNPVKDRWQAVSWVRWVSPEEEKAERIRKKKAVKTTLSDGSEVLEGDVSIEAVSWHEETPQALRDEIVATITALIDPEAPAAQITTSRNRLIEIGKHAVPGLLMRIAEISPDVGLAGAEVPADFQLTYDQAVQINQCHIVLDRVITNWSTTYQVDKAMGSTDERQASGIRQWFGWYERKFKIFWRDADMVVEEDAFWDDPDFKPRNEKEAREFEKARRERDARRGDG